MKKHLQNCTPDNTCDECKEHEVVVEFLRESNAIEGVYDVDSLMQAKTAWDFLMTKKKLTMGTILKVHKILMLNQNLLPSEKGYFRTVTVYIGNKPAINALKIKSQMIKWLADMNDRMVPYRLPKREDKSKELHVTYEKIHPFVDGNGRTGRMFMNWWRLQHGLPIMTIHEGPQQFDYYRWFK